MSVVALSTAAYFALCPLADAISRNYGLARCTHGISSTRISLIPATEEKNLQPSSSLASSNSFCMFLITSGVTPPVSLPHLARCALGLTSPMAPLHRRMTLEVHWDPNSKLALLDFGPLARLTACPLAINNAMLGRAHHCSRPELERRDRDGKA